MKYYKIIVLSIFLLSTFFLGKVHAKVHNYSLQGKCIYIDPGHGGKDSGAISKKFLEKDMNLLLSEKLASILFNQGAMIYLTRDGDYDLSKSTINRKRNDLYTRANLINKSNCDLYVSIHLNSSPSPRWSGIQVFYSNINKSNKKIATIITNQLKQDINNIRDYKKENNYYMYSKIKVPGILIEAGFISNNRDNYNLRKEEYQDKLVKSIADGISIYLNS